MGLVLSLLALLLGQSTRYQVSFSALKRNLLENMSSVHTHYKRKQRKRETKKPEEAHENVRSVFCIIQQHHISSLKGSQPGT